MVEVSVASTRAAEILSTVLTESPTASRCRPVWWNCAPGASGAQVAGLAAVFALLLRVGGIRVGVLDLHRTTAGGLALDVLNGVVDFSDDLDSQ
jgi:hypothetical protein